jgi:hypothetical protein
MAEAASVFSRMYFLSPRNHKYNISDTQMGSVSPDLLVQSLHEALIECLQRISHLSLLDVGHISITGIVRMLPVVVINLSDRIHFKHLRPKS